MSWLVRSLASLTATDDDGEDAGGGDEGRSGGAMETSAPSMAGEGEEGSGTVNPGRGVKEDLSELTKTVSHQLWGVASFLAPPPPSPPSTGAGTESPPSDPVTPTETPDLTTSGKPEYSQVLAPPRVAGIRSDFVEIGGRLRSGIAMLSKNKAVTEISKIASSFLQFGSDGEEEEEDHWSGDRSAVGVTEEVLMFVWDISMHPGTWLNFPLFPGDKDAEDFNMSPAQQEHALAVEHLIPGLADLRIGLCPCHMSVGCFWKIYFILLHPKLNKHDAELLSTAQIVEARAILSQELQNRNRSATDSSIGGASCRKEHNLCAEHVAASSTSCINTRHEKEIVDENFARTDSETEKHLVSNAEIRIVDKSVIEEVPAKITGLSNAALKASTDKYEEDGHGWLEEVTSGSIPIGNEEDVSFSDLEEDESTTACLKAVTDINSQIKDPNGWLPRDKNSGASTEDGKAISPKTHESNEWSDLEDIDAI